MSITDENLVAHKPCQSPYSVMLLSVIVCLAGKRKANKATSKMLTQRLND